MTAGPTRRRPAEALRNGRVAGEWPGPRRSVASQVEARGSRAVVAGCVDLLTGGRADPPLVAALGGPPARWAVTGEPGGPDYWLRVWAARGLLWEWRAEATAAVVAALGDEAWRVREMAARVVARHAVDEALTAVAALTDDPNARVRRAAERALVALTRSQ